MGWPPWGSVSYDPSHSQYSGFCSSSHHSRAVSRLSVVRITSCVRRESVGLLSPRGIVSSSFPSGHFPHFWTEGGQICSKVCHGTEGGPTVDVVRRDA